MKRLFIGCLALLIGSSSFSQTTKPEETPIYRRFPTVPLFTIYKAPDSTAFTRDNLQKRKNTIFIVFSPDCGYCQHETEMLTANLNRFKNTQVVMVTYLPWDEMMAFYRHFKIADYPQITMGRDTKFFFPTFFSVKNLPSIYIYDKKGNFKKAFEGDVKPESIIAEL